MGNHLFQYAFALSASKKLHTLYVIDDRNTKDVFLKYFERISFTDYSFVRKILLLAFRLKKNTSLLQQSGYEEDINEVLNKITDNCYYDGYFQSSFFFKNVIDALPQKIKIKKAFRKQFDDKYGQLFNNKKILAIHCRLGDYLVYNSETLGGTNIALPESYYLNALSLISDLDQYHVIVVTDDIENFGSRLSFIKNKTVVSESEIMDFQILMNADALIISNSTFSWWAAYLNSKKPPIFSPKFWLGFKVKKEFPVNILPENFTSVSVE